MIQHVHSTAPGETATHSGMLDGGLDSAIRHCQHFEESGAEAPRHPLPRLPAQWAVMLFCNSASLYDQYYPELYDNCYPFISLLSSSNTGLMFEGAQTLSYNVNHYYLGV